MYIHLSGILKLFPFYFQDGVTSFCHFPFLFDAEAKSILLHNDALLQMQVHHSSFTDCVFVHTYPYV